MKTISKIIQQLCVLKKSMAVFFGNHTLTLSPQWLKEKKAFLILLPIVLILQSCVRDANIEIPGAVDKIVVEGSIEPGQPPIIFLTRNKPYFGTNNFASFSDLLVHDAYVSVSNGTSTVVLTEICASSLPDSLLPLLSGITGLDSATLKNIDFCLYTTFDPTMFGVEGKTYDLYVNAESKTLTSKTKIPTHVDLDSIWYKNEGSFTDRGFVWARLNDPDTLGNAYRWFAMRKNIDYSFYSPIGSAFEDKFINGTSFEFAYNRARSPSDDETNLEFLGYFKVGDTIIVKFTSIDEDVYQFWRTYETQVVNNGNPFAAPTPINSNIEGEGGLGIWCGYGVSYDTTVAQ